MAASTNDSKKQESGILNCENKYENSQEIINNVTRATGAYDKIRKILSESITGFTWSIKPRSVAPPVCASLGWVISQKNLLECVSCHQFLSTELPPVWKQSAYDHAVSTLRVSLTDKHHQFCCWPLNPSKQNYLQERLLDSKLTLEAFAATLFQLNELQDNKLLNLASDLPEELIACDFLLQTCASTIQVEHTELRKTVLVLAICGWQTKQTLSCGRTLFCTACFRETMPSLYNPTSEAQLSSSLTTSSDEYSPSIKRSRKSQVIEFHPLKEHQSWCPWVDRNYKTANGTPIKEGWKTLMDILTAHSKDDDTKGFKARTMESHRNGVLTTKRTIRKWIAKLSLENVLHVD